MGSRLQSETGKTMVQDQAKEEKENSDLKKMEKIKHTALKQQTGSEKD